MLAAKEGHTSCVKLLLDEITMKDENGWTALYYASKNVYYECIELLL